MICAWTGCCVADVQGLIEDVDREVVEIDPEREELLVAPLDRERAFVEISRQLSRLFQGCFRVREDGSVQDHQAAWRWYIWGGAQGPEQADRRDHSHQADEAEVLLMVGLESKGLQFLAFACLFVAAPCGGSFYPVLTG